MLGGADNPNGDYRLISLALTRSAGNDFSPATPNSVNQLIQRPTKGRVQQSCSDSITNAVAPIQH